MPRHALFCLLPLFAISAVASGAPDSSGITGISATTSAGRTAGALEVRWAPQQAQPPAAFEPWQGELRVYALSKGLRVKESVKAGVLVQALPASVTLERAQDAYLEFLDLNDDGYQDLLFYNVATGSGGVSLAAEVFMWDARAQRFVRSDTLSQEGELTKSPKPGCVDVTRKCSSFSYNITMYCFKPAPRGGGSVWRVSADNGCPEVQP